MPGELVIRHSERERRMLSLWSQLRSLAVSVSLSAASTVAAPVTPCLTAGSACTEWIVLGGGPSRSLVYRTYPLDKRNDAITRVLVSIHGAARDADNYFRSTLAAGFLADAFENTLIIVPRLASNDGAGCRDVLAPNEISWNCNSWRSGGPANSNPGVTSFDFLDEILRKVARKDLFPNLKAIVVVGHSAGGQVVNRYEMANQIHDKLGVPVTYVVANPSSYAYPDSVRPTDAAYAITSNPPGYIPEVAPNESLFRHFGDARNCTTYDQWPYGLRNHTGYSAKQTDDQLRQQLASRLDDVPSRPARHSAARRLRRLVRRDGAGPHAARPRRSVRAISKRETRRSPRGRDRPTLRPQCALHVHVGRRAAAALPEGRERSTQP